MNKKIALCLSGYFDSLNDNTSKGLDGFNYLQKHILNKYDSDIFIHCWQPELQDKILKLYNPQQYCFEKQINFSELVKLNGLSHLVNQPRLPETVFSHFYSVQSSFKLLYSQEKKYDIVIKSRFDIGRINRNTSGPGKHNPFPVQCINFNPNLDMNFIYVANWQYFNDGPPDMWFYSGYDNMKHFCNIFDKIKNNYLIINSDYYNSDINNVSNAIRLYKKFFQDVRILSKLKPLDTQWE